MNNSYYINKLKEIFLTRQKANKSYSLRAFARDIGIHSSSLSLILNEKRSIPSKMASEVSDRLKLSSIERTLFIESIIGKKASLDEIKIDADNRFILDESYSNVLSQWEHYTVLTLFDLDNFTPTIECISNHLGISYERTEEVLENLLSCNLISTSHENIFVKTHERVRTTEDVSIKALRDSHLENLEIAKIKLDEISVELRDFSSITFAVDPEKIDEIKTLIREFRQKIATHTKNGKKSKVYQMAIQLYPLTRN